MNSKARCLCMIKDYISLLLVNGLVLIDALKDTSGSVMNPRCSIRSQCLVFLRFTGWRPSPASWPTFSGCPPAQRCETPWILLKRGIQRSYTSPENVTYLSTSEMFLWIRVKSKRHTHTDVHANVFKTAQIWLTNDGFIPEGEERRWVWKVPTELLDVELQVGPAHLLTTDRKLCSGPFLAGWVFAGIDYSLLFHAKWFIEAFKCFNIYHNHQQTSCSFVFLV